MAAFFMHVYVMTACTYYFQSLSLLPHHTDNPQYMNGLRATTKYLLLAQACPTAGGSQVCYALTVSLEVEHAHLVAWTSLQVEHSKTLGKLKKHTASLSTVGHL